MDIKIAENITISGFDSIDEFKTWLGYQDKNCPNSVVVSLFKWFLMELEEGVAKGEIRQSVIDAVDKYAKLMIERKIMKEQDVYKFIYDAEQKGEIDEPKTGTRRIQTEYSQLTFLENEIKKS